MGRYVGVVCHSDVCWCGGDQADQEDLMNVAMVHVHRGVGLRGVDMIKLPGGEYNEDCWHEVCRRSDMSLVFFLD